MPDIYTHPNGYTVKRDDRGVRLAITSNTGYSSTWIDNPKVDALRDYLLHELGLWLDEETGLVVLNGTWADLGNAVAAKVYDGRVTRWGRPGNAEPNPRDEAVARYLATLVPPPREPQLGEVWRVTRVDGSECNALVDAWTTGAPVWRTESGGDPIAAYPPSRRRILIEADGTVVSDE